MPKGANSKVYIRGQKAIEYGSNKNPDPKHCLNLSCFMDCWLTLFVDSCLHIVFLGLHNSHCCFSLTAHCVWLIAPLRWEHAFFACTLYFLLTAHCVSSILCVSRMFVVLILTWFQILKADLTRRRDEYIGEAKRIQARILLFNVSDPFSFHMDPDPA